ncbi:hypothetical protein J6590_101564, partial [Homalodisca vitripennis]
MAEYFISYVLHEGTFFSLRVTERYFNLVRSVATRGETIVAILMSGRFSAQFIGYPGVILK